MTRPLPGGGNDQGQDHVCSRLCRWPRWEKVILRGVEKLIPVSPPGIGEQEFEALKDGIAAEGPTLEEIEARLP